MDLNTIPLGLVERVEIITDGASAIYGGDAVAGVINIILKKSWVGTEVNGSMKLTEHGGARERQTTITTGVAGLGGRFHGTLAISYYDRDPLFAAQRTFSKNPDFRTRVQGYNATTGAPVLGTDQRIQWGYPAAVQATATTGFVSIPGVRVLLAPEGSATTPAVAASSLYWSKGPWTASSSLSYMSGFQSDRASISSNPQSNLPAMRLIDVRASYEFKDGVWRKYGKGLRVGAGIANLTDAEPPFTNNIYGFNAGVYGRWAFGRTFELSFAQPF